MPAQRRYTCVFLFVPVLVVTIFTVLPQFMLMRERGDQWAGSSFTLKGDSTGYMAYVNALINGRPRKNDPILGLDDENGAPRSESFYSIQFVPAYALAIPARLFSISSSMASFGLEVTTSVLFCVSIFFLIRTLTGDDALSGVAALMVPCLGTAVALQGQAAHRLELKVLVEFFSFLRVYQPAFAIPFFFLFCLSVCMLFASKSGRAVALYFVTSALLFALLVFSYFYLWTAAAAWAACFFLAWLVLRPAERRQTIMRGISLGLSAVAALIPWLVMIFDRSTKMDEIQILTPTRQPDLFRITELLAFVLLIVLGLIGWFRRDFIHRTPFIVAVSLALSPFLLFNQQILTGRSLQPFHYEIFISNYLCLTAIALVLWMILQERWVPSVVRIAVLVAVAIGSAGWGYIESSRFARRNIKGAIERDEAIKALGYVNQLQNEAAVPASGASGEDRLTIFAIDWSIIELIPVATNNRPLWNHFSSAAGGLDRRGERDLFYHYLYYSGTDELSLRQAIEDEQFLVMVPLFGFAKVVPELGEDVGRISPEEIDQAVKEYREFVAGFGQTKAADPQIHYAIVTDDQVSMLGNLDRWYKRGDGKDLGRYWVYSLELKDEVQAR